MKVKIGFLYFLEKLSETSFWFSPKIQVSPSIPAWEHDEKELVSFLTELF